MFKNFKELKIGVKRAIIVGTIPGAMLLSGIISAFSRHGFRLKDFWSDSVFLGIPLYWIMVLVGVWIYEGFKKID